MTDSELVAQTLSGRAEAYAELARRWAGRVTALCHAHAGCAASADDLAQEALLRGYRMLGSLQEPAKFGPWLTNIARNACLNWKKAKERALVPFSALGPDRNPDDFPGAPTIDALEQDEELGRLRAEVAALPEDCREVLLLYYHQEVTYRQLADMLNVSSATINARLTRARVLLRERLGERELP